VYDGESDAYHYHGVRTAAAQMGEPDAKRSMNMRCSITGCAGAYEQKLITHTVRHQGDIVVIDHVPAEVCSLCGDVLFTPDTVRRLERMLETLDGPARTVPLYEYS
jgi:YgiT-type zinc finger domain-containing protein